MNVFTAIPSDQVGALGEAALITRLRRWLGKANPEAPFGIGDDCAMLPRSPGKTLVTVDPVVYGQHFDDEVPAAGVGAKLLHRNASDIAAMGGTPRYAVLSLLLRPDVSVAWLRRFYQGLAKAAIRCGVKVVGGDVAQADGFSASLTLLGDAPARPLLRTGSRAGDSLWVTGQLGGSRLGHHYRFRPRLAEGAWLSQQPEVRAMMDVSDGLAKDLLSLTPKGLWPALVPESVPVSQAAYRMARRTGRSPLDHALSDGEDFELVFALRRGVSPQEFHLRWSRQFRTRLTEIGTFQPLSARSQKAFDVGRFHGYEHLREA